MAELFDGHISEREYPLTPLKCLGAGRSYADGLVFNAPLGSNAEDLITGEIGTHVRASTATYQGDDGYLKYAAINEPRFEGGELLTGPGYTQSCLQNRNMDTAPWNQVGTPALTQNAIGIDGVVNTAWTIEDDSTSALEFNRQDITVANDNATHTALFFVGKDQDENRFVELEANLIGGTSSLRGVQVNTKTGAYAITAGSAGDFAVSSYNSDFWEVTINNTNNISGNTTLRLNLIPAYSKTLGGAQDVTTTGSAVFDMPCVFLNSSFPFSPVETTSVPVEITADSPVNYPMSDELTGIFQEELGPNQAPTACCTDPDNDQNTTYGWLQGSSATVLASVADGRTGYCLSVSENNGDNPRFNKRLPVTPGEVYRYSGYAKAGTESTFQSVVYDVTNGWPVIATTGNKDAASDWSTSWVRYVTIPDGCVEVAIQGHQICVAGAGTDIFFDDIKFEKVTRPAKGTAVMKWTPRYDWNDLTLGNNHPLIELANSTVGLMYIRREAETASVGRTYAGSGAAVGKPLSFLSGTEYLVAVQWGAVNDNALQMRGGAIDASVEWDAAAWGNWGDFDGAYKIQDNLRLLFGAFGANQIRNVQIYNKVLTDDEINALGSP